MSDHNYHSSVNLVGKILRMSQPEEYARTAYFYMRVLFRDENSPAKFINVFCWDCKDDVIALNLEVGDTVEISGELAYIEKEGKGTHAIRGKRVSIINKKSESELVAQEPRMKF